MYHLKTTMKMQLLTIAALAVFGCTSGTPVPFNENESEEEANTETHLIDVPIEKRAVSSKACLDKLYIMAFTSGIDYAQSDSIHAVEILGAGHVRNLRLYNLPGDEHSQNKGDLWKYNITSFQFPFSCLNISMIQRVYIIESSDDGWNIDSIVTLVGAGGSFQVLTQDLDVNRWIDGDSHHTYRRFELTLA